MESDEKNWSYLGDLFMDAMLALTQEKAEGAQDLWEILVANAEKPWSLEYREREHVQSPVMDLVRLKMVELRLKGL